MTALAAIEGANPASGAAADGAGTLSGWDSPRARFGGDGTASGVTEVVSHASQLDGDALAWYSPLGDGSTRGIYGVAGAVLAAVDYGPYGAPGMHNAGAAPAFSYTGKPYDAATGLYHFPYRQYDPNAARWLTRDPLGMVDGPNVYAYVTGNPVGAVDPMGLAIEVCVRPLRGLGGPFFNHVFFHDTTTGKRCGVAKGEPLNVVNHKHDIVKEAKCVKVEGSEGLESRLMACCEQNAYVIAKEYRAGFNDCYTNVDECLELTRLTVEFERRQKIAGPHFKGFGGHPF